MTGQRIMVLNGKTRFRLNIRRKPAFCKGGDALAQAAQRIFGWPNPGNVQSQVGWSSEQLSVVKGAPAHGRAAGARCFSRLLPS